MKTTRIPFADRARSAWPATTLRAQAEQNAARDRAFELEAAWQKGQRFNRREYLRACLASLMPPRI